MPPACIVGFQSVETARQHTKEMWEGARFPLWHSSVSECGGCLCSHPTVAWCPLDSRFEQGRYFGPMDGSNTVIVGTASGVVKARTTKRLSPGERWTGSLLDEALGSELTPLALEDDGCRVGIRAPVLQPHAAIPLPPLVPEFRQAASTIAQNRRRAVWPHRQLPWMRKCKSRS